MERPAEPSESSRRRFLIADAMMLVVVAALMATAKAQFYWMWQGIPDLSYGGYELNRFCVGVALANASVVWFASLLVRPIDRRRLRRGAPGLIVPMAVAIVLGMNALDWLTSNWSSRWLRGDDVSFQAFLLILVTHGRLPLTVSIAIAVAWITLAVVGRWRPEPAWDDRLGRLLAVCWLILGPGEMLVRAWLFR
jgi:hypothetical protein